MQNSILNPASAPEQVRFLDCRRCCVVSATEDVRPAAFRMVDHRDQVEPALNRRPRDMAVSSALTVDRVRPCIERTGTPTSVIQTRSFDHVATGRRCRSATGVEVRNPCARRTSRAHDVLHGPRLSGVGDTTLNRCVALKFLPPELPRVNPRPQLDRFATKARCRVGPRSSEDRYHLRSRAVTPDHQLFIAMHAFCGGENAEPTGSRVGHYRCARLTTSPSRWDQETRYRPRIRASSTEIPSFGQCREHNCADGGQDRSTSSVAKLLGETVPTQTGTVTMERRPTCPPSRRAVRRSTRTPISGHLGPCCTRCSRAHRPDSGRVVANMTASLSSELRRSRIRAILRIRRAGTTARLLH